MSHRPSHLVVISAMVASSLLLGCSSGGGGDGSEGRSARDGSAAPTSTTATPTRIDLSKPIPGGSLHGTPRPPLENTGDNYVAIFESLVANFRWLSENPDPALISELYVPGTQDHDAGVENFQYLVNQGWRAADDGYYLVSTEVVDARAEAISLRVADAMDEERIVDANGTQVGAGRPRAPQIREWSILLTPDSDGRWRIADWGPAEAEVEV